MRPRRLCSHATSRHSLRYPALRLLLSPELSWSHPRRPAFIPTFKLGLRHTDNVSLHQVDPLLTPGAFPPSPSVTVAWHRQSRRARYLATCVQALFGSVDQGMELVVDLLAGICEVVQDGEHTAAHQDLFRQVQAATCCVLCLYMCRMGSPLQPPDHQDLLRQEGCDRLCFLSFQRWMHGNREHTLLAGHHEGVRAALHEGLRAALHEGVRGGAAWGRKGRRCMRA